MGNPESKEALPPGSPVGSPWESINEPPGSQVIPPGAGAGTGEEVVHPPGSIPEGPTGPAAEAPVIEALDPDEADAGDVEDIVMHVHGTGFTSESVITFNGLDEPTTFVSETEVTTGVKPSLFVVPAICPVTVRNGTLESEALEFEFLDVEAEEETRSTKRTKPKPAGKKKR